MVVLRKPLAAKVVQFHPRPLKGDRLMARYKIEIPAPKASRMAKTERDVIVSINSGWGGSCARRHTIPASQTTFAFDVPDRAEYAGTCTTCDGLVFDVQVHFFNELRTRCEIVKPIPVLRSTPT